MSDLTAFLTARLDEDEQQTRKLLCRAQEVCLELKEPKLLGRHIPGWDSWCDVEKLCVRALREVEAKRRIMGRHRDDGCGYCAGCETSTRHSGIRELAPSGECPEKRDLAAIYSDHPDYRQEWAP